MICEKLSDKDYRQLMKLGWDEYMFPMIDRLQPEAVIILGHHHANAIGEKGIERVKSMDIPVHVVTHPSSRGHQQSAYMPHLREVRDLTAKYTRQGEYD